MRWSLADQRKAKKRPNSFYTDLLSLGQESVQDKGNSEFKTMKKAKESHFTNFPYEFLPTHE